MREFWKKRGACDRLLAATVTTLALATATLVSFTAASAQSGPAKTPAELAIEAAVPVPEPAKVVPPSPSDFVAQAKALATGGGSDAKSASPDPTAAESASTTKTSENKPAETKAEDSKPADATSTQNDASGSEPKQADGKDVKAPDTKPDGTQPPQETAKQQPPARDDSKKIDSADKAPAAEPAKAEATKTDDNKPAAETAQGASAKPTSPVAAADQPVADKLRDLLTAKSSKYFERKNERTAVETFYSERSFAPLWTAGGAPTDRATSVIARLKAADKDGLDPADYPAPDFAAAKTPDDLAEAELKLTASMLDYARQAQSGRLHWSHVSPDIAYPEHPVDPTEVLINVTTAKDASAALDSYNPPQPQYRALKAKLAELRGETDNPPPKIDEGPTLRFVAETGKRSKKTAVAPEDARVPQLRVRLGVTENAGDDHYDEAVASAVRKFQTSTGLDATGALNSQTVRALNSPKRDHDVEMVMLNMERWRWLPRNLGEPKLNNAYVILNIPDYTLQVRQGDAEVWKTRVVTGKPGIHATPLLSETMKFITINPTWNVPPSIIENEYLPALAQDPTVLERMGLRLETAPDGSVHISQPPGDANALGRIRFNFPNKFLVYQHDTPDKYLFAKDERAYSHGCMRVQYPDQYAEVLLGITDPQGHYTVAKIHSMYGSSEENINFPTPIPVHITYQTAFVDEGGQLDLRRDVYGRDAELQELLRNRNRATAEVAIEHGPAQISSVRTKLPIAQTADNGPNFFNWLFSGPPPQPVQPMRHPRRAGPPR